MNLKEIQELLEKHQSCLHCGKQGHNHANCLRKFVSEQANRAIKQDLIVEGGRTYER